MSYAHAVKSLMTRLECSTALNYKFYSYSRYKFIIKLNSILATINTL